MQRHLTRSRFALMLSVALVALSVTLAPASALAEKKGAATAESKAKPKVAKAKPKAKATAKPASVHVPRAIGPKPEVAPKAEPVPAKDKDGKDIDPLERKDAGKLDGHKWRPRARG